MPTFLDRENWMSHLDKSVRLVDSHIPASHDSSCYPTTNLFQTAYNEWVGAVTQLAGYTSQLNAGVRYFDMRIRWHDGELYMHHNDEWYFEKFDDVLAQIRRFSDDHGGEYIFMDLDFDDEPSIVDAILKSLESHLDDKKFATAHLRDGRFDPNVTWEALGTARFLITWSHDNWEHRLWASNSAYFRDSPFDDFNKHDVSWILDYLEEHLRSWDKQRMMISQVVNTPLASFITPPGERDADAQARLNAWVNAAGPRTNVVMRDFVNAGYNRNVIDNVIKLNRFASAPNYTTSNTQIHQRDTVRFRVEGTSQYLGVGPDKRLTLKSPPDASCEFVVRDYDYDPTGPLPYSGNMDADTLDARGNFRMVQGDDICVSVGTDQGNGLYLGIGWGPADDLETFTSFDPDDLGNTGELFSGSRVLIRSMMGSAGDFFEKVLNVVKEDVVVVIPFTGHAFLEAVRSDPGRHIFVLVTYDGSGTPRIVAASPGTDYATVFVIEK